MICVQSFISIRKDYVGIRLPPNTDQFFEYLTIITLKNLRERFKLVRKCVRVSISDSPDSPV